MKANVGGKADEFVMLCSLSKLPLRSTPEASIHPDLVAGTKPWALKSESCVLPCLFNLN
jgi:hypothetical protein